MRDVGKIADIVSCQLGSRDDPYWITLYPNEPLTFTEKFLLPVRPPIPRYGPLKPGHRYRLGINRRFKFCPKWLDGRTREDIMTTEPKLWGGGQFEDSQIVVPPGDVVEFEVRE